MHSVRDNAYKGMMALSAFVLALAAGAAPLPRDAASATGDGRTERRLSEADLALSDPRLDLPETSSAQLLGTDGGRRANSADPQVFDLGQAGSPQSIQEMLRGFVTVRRAGAQASAAPPRANNRRPPEDAMGVDLGLSTNEWIRESVQGVITSVLSLAVDERGNASFAVLGLGDFSIVISADRSELAFTSGDEVLASMRRGGADPAAGAGYPGYDDGPRGYGPAAPPVPGDSPFRRALELILEVASHPLSFIVYALMGGYALLWGLLSVRAKRPISGGGSHRSSRHHSVSSVLDAAAMIPAPAVKKPRKRTRVRVRARKYR